MTARLQHRSATILPFPRKVSAAAEARARDVKAADLAARHGPAVESGAWYHQAAVQEAERARKP